MSIIEQMPDRLLDRIDAADAAAFEPGNEINTELARLAALSPIEYDRQRAAAAGHLDCRVTTLDAMVRQLRPTDSVAGSGEALSLDRPEPWPEPVTGAELLAEIARTVARYVVLPAGAADALALWVMHSHAHDAADHSPILAITSPEKRCGKTTLLHVVTALVPVPLPTANISPAAVFRTIEKWRPTLLIDEADTFLAGDGDTLRGVLNSGHSRASAYVIRTVGDDHEPRRFATWAPKAIVCIGTLPGTLADRSIEIRLRRAMPGDARERYRPRLTADHMDELCCRAARWAADHLPSLTDADPDLPDALHDRAQDCWRALIAVADAIGGEWPVRARAAALTLSGAGAAEDQSRGVMLLSDIRDVFNASGCERIPSAALATKLGEMEHRPWADWRGKSITQAGVAKLLAPYGIEPRVMRIGGETPRGYQRISFGDAWSRYLPGADSHEAQQPPSAADPRSESAKPQQTNDFIWLQQKQSATRMRDVAPSKPEIINEINDAAGVALSNPPSPQRGMARVRI